MPYQAEKLCFPAGGVYRMKLTLEDPTARIHAAVVGADGVRSCFNFINFAMFGANYFKLFRGHYVCNLYD